MLTTHLCCNGTETARPSTLPAGLRSSAPEVAVVRSHARDSAPARQPALQWLHRAVDRALCLASCGILCPGGFVMHIFLACLTHRAALVLQACTAKMNLSEEVDLEDYVGRPDKISNAEISAICQEAGMHAVRKNR